LLTVGITVATAARRQHSLPVTRALSDVGYRRNFDSRRRDSDWRHDSETGKRGRRRSRHRRTFQTVDQTSRFLAPGALLAINARRRLLPADDARVIARWAHGRCSSADASVRIEAVDHAGRKRRCGMAPANSSRWTDCTNSMASPFSKSALSPVRAGPGCDPDPAATARPRHSSSAATALSAALASGGILAMLANSLIPFAHERSKSAGTWTVLGFCFALALGG
jgi:hypothetical protein